MNQETVEGGTAVFRASWQETGNAEIDRLIGCSSLGTPVAKSLRKRAPAGAVRTIISRADSVGHGPFAIGIEILPDELRGVITDPQGGIRDCRRWGPLLDMEVDSVVKHVAKVAKDLAATALGLDLPHPSIGIGLQLGGPVDTHTGTVIRYENNPTDPAVKPHRPYLWENEKLAERVERETGCRTVLENDTAALASVVQRFGAGQEHSTYAVILIRDGVGCNVVMENKLLPGPWELGHIIVWPNGRKCECGLVGDIESQAGRRAIKAVVGKEAGLADPEWPHAVKLALEDGRRADKALRAFELAGEAIGRGIAKLVTLLNPSCVVLYAPPELIEPSDGNSRVTDAFMGAVEKFRRQTFPPQNECDLLTRRMQPTDGALGAALIALSRIFSVPLAPASPNWST